MNLRHFLLTGITLGLICLAGFAVTAYAAVLPLASDPKYTNNSSEEGKFDGSIEFKPAADQSNITDYVVYFLNSQKEKIQLIGKVNVQKEEDGLAYTRSMGHNFRNGYYALVLQREDEIDIPAGTKYIGIYSSGANGESDGFVTAYVWQNSFDSYYIKDARFEDKNPQRGKIEGTLSWKLAPDATDVKGFLVRYFDGEKFHELKAPYGRIEAGQQEFTIPVNADLIPAMASNFYIQPLIELQSNEAGPGGKAYITDDISADTKGLTVTTPGVPVPENVKFKDTDLRGGFISGTVSWEAEDKEFMQKEYSSGMTPFVYSLYFLDANDKKIKGISSIPRDYYQHEFYELNLPADLKIPSSAKAIGVYLQMAASEGIKFGKVEIRDDTGKDFFAKEARFVDTAPKQNVIKGKVSWKASNNESELKGYALFADNATKPFATVATGKTYSVIIPDNVVKNGSKTIHILPMSKQGQYVHSTSFKDARVQISDNMLAETKPGMGTLERNGAGRMYGSDMLEDEDPRPGFIGGVLEAEAKVPSGTTQWYFYDHKGSRLAPIGKVKFQITPNRETVAFVIPVGTKIPAGAVYIGASKPDADGKIVESGAMINDDASAKSVTFSDVSKKSVNAITFVASSGIIPGYKDGTFRPSQKVTRAQFASIVVRAFRLKPQPYKGTFKDVKAADAYAADIAAVVKAGLTAGSEGGTFRPNQVITRQEMYAMIERILLWRTMPTKLNDVELKKLSAKYSDWDQVPERFYPVIDKLNYYDLLPDSNTLDLDRTVTREECAVTIHQLLISMYS